MTVIFRHGETQYNTEDRLQGWSDSPLTDRGISQVRNTAAAFNRRLTEQCYTQLFCSSLNRSKTSAVLFSKIINLDSMTACDSLRENSWGDLEGLLSCDLRIKPFMDARAFNKFLTRPPNGESLADLYERVSRFLDINHLREDREDLLNIFHVHENVSKVLRGIFLRVHPSIWMDFTHPQDTYYIINSNHCEECKI